ncbi:hypothetical protein [Actinokineospora sp.]|uniref:hypothetical protein n=1 Tax=Actinokineospora sp. TaxID=1872133 RepID=UPI003D6BA0FF
MSGGAAGAAWPDSPGKLTATAKLAGLGASVTITVAATADPTSTHACRNNGGDSPADPKTTQTVTTVTASGQFTSGKNGRLSATLTGAPPAATVACPPGQRAVMVSVTYTGVTVSAGPSVTTSVAGTFSRTFFTI